MSGVDGRLRLERGEGPGTGGAPSEGGGMGPATERQESRA